MKIYSVMRRWRTGTIEILPKCFESDAAARIYVAEKFFFVGVLSWGSITKDRATSLAVDEQGTQFTIYESELVENQKEIAEKEDWKSTTRLECVVRKEDRRQDKPKPADALWQLADYIDPLTLKTLHRAVELLTIRLDREFQLEYDRDFRRDYVLDAIAEEVNRAKFLYTHLPQVVRTGGPTNEPT